MLLTLGKGSINSENNLRLLPLDPRPPQGFFSFVFESYLYETDFKLGPNQNIIVKPFCDWLKLDILGSIYTYIYLQKNILGCPGWI